jgi:hypothetical protein
MQDLLYRLVERMLRDGSVLSRNKNFDAFDDARLGGALRIVRQLRSLEADLLRFGLHGAVRRDCQGKYRLEIRMDEIRGRRLAYLNAREFDLLCINPTVRGLFAPALGDARMAHP